MTKLLIIGSTPGLGLAIQFTQMALWLTEQGMEVHLAGSDGEATPGQFDLLRKHGIPFHDVPELRKTGLKQMVRPAGGLTRLLKEVQPDVLLATTIGHLTEAARMKLRPKTIFWLQSIRNTRFYAPAARILASLCANQQADQAWLLCLNEKNTMIRYGLRKDFTQIVPIPIDVEWWLEHSQRPLSDVFSPVAAAREKGRPVLVYPASLLPGKGHAILFKALSIVRQTYPDVFLCCPGRFSSDYLQPLIQSLDLSNHVMFTESLIRQEDIPPLLRHSDIMVSTSRSETYGKSMLEALLMGLPMVSTRAGIAFEAEQAGVALVCDVDDYNKVAEHLLFLLGDESYRRELGQKARDWVLQNYSYEALGEKMMHLIDQVCE